MKKVQIFVEGPADQKFIQDLIEEWYGKKMLLAGLGKEGDIFETQGKDAFHTTEKLAKLVKLFEMNKIQGVQNIVIFDADSYQETYVYLNTKREELGFNFFLLPNNQSNGDLETLLENIIAPENQGVFECWSSYEQCLRQSDLTTPAKKTKIYAYLEALLGDSKSQKRTYKRTQTKL